MVLVGEISLFHSSSERADVKLIERTRNLSVMAWFEQSASPRRKLIYGPHTYGVEVLGMGIGVYDCSAHLLCIPFRSDQSCLGSTETTTIPHSNVEAASLAGSYSLAVLRGCYHRRSARTESGDQSHHYSLR